MCHHQTFYIQAKLGPCNCFNWIAHGSRYEERKLYSGLIGLLVLTLCHGQCTSARRDKCANSRKAGARKCHGTGPRVARHGKLMQTVQRLPEGLAAWVSPRGVQFQLDVIT